MYLDKVASKKIKKIELNKVDFIKASKTVAFTLSFTLLATACANKNEVYNNNLNDIYQIEKYEDKYNELCDYGHLIVKKNNSNNFYYYKISNLFLISEDSLNKNYYLATVPNLRNDIINCKECNYSNPIINIFKQTSIMHNIFKNNKLKEENGLYSIEITEEQFNEYLNNWDGKIIKNNIKTEKRR